MLVLTASTDKIEVVLAGSVTTNQLDCFTSYRDITATTYEAGRNPTVTNNTTAINLVTGSATSGVQRVIDYCSIYNNDTANATVTIKFDDGTNERVLYKAILAPGEKIEYKDAQGWQSYNNVGAVKLSINQGGNSASSELSQTVLASDVTNNNASANSIADVTGLSFPVTNGDTYYFQFVIHYTSAATNTGSRWSISGPGGTMRYRSQYSLTTTSQTVNEGLSAHDTPAAANATSAATGANIAIIEGFYTASADGSVIARFASEVSSSAIVAKAGSTVWYNKVLDV